MVDTQFQSPRPVQVAGANAPVPAVVLSVSWGAVFAGAVSAAALSLILLILGTGLGLSAVSPWVAQGDSVQTIGVSTIVWVTFMQLAAAGLGGYLAGRLRNPWDGAPHDEVYFRDTAHGFLAWGLATLATAALLTSTIGSILGTTAQTGATVAAGAAESAIPMVRTADQSTEDSESMGYFVDSMFRREPPAPGSSATATPVPEDGSARAEAEVARILANALSTGKLPADDVKHAGALVAQRTGLSQADAEKRVNDAFSRAQARARAVGASALEAADKARKASAYASLWLFVSLLIGAFIASLAATYGGRHRDRF